MTKKDVIIEVCTISSLVYHSIGDYSEPCDGFCAECDALHGGNWNYQNSGKVLEYIRQAVMDKLTKDGIKIHKNFDPTTGGVKL